MIYARGKGEWDSVATSFSVCPKIKWKKYCIFENNAYLCTRILDFTVDSLAQQVEHIPFKDGVLGSSPKRITKECNTSIDL